MITVLVILAIVVSIIVILALRQADTFSVVRSIDVGAPPQAVHDVLNGFGRWHEWNPWQKLDAAMKQTREGPATGVGAVYAWDGNSKAGAGRMEIDHVTADQEVQMKLDFYRPFKSHNRAIFCTESSGAGTKVTWTMTGPMQFISKLMSVFMSMDKMIGKDFEEGLRNLKALVEK